MGDGSSCGWTALGDDSLEFFLETTYSPVIHYCVVNRNTGFHGAYATADEAKTAMTGMVGSRAAFEVMDGFVRRDAHVVKDSNGVGQGGSGWTNFWHDYSDIFAMADIAEGADGCIGFAPDKQGDLCLIINSPCSRYEQIYGPIECGDKDMNEWCGRFTDPNDIVEGLSGTTLFKEVCPATCEPFEPRSSHHIVSLLFLIISKSLIPSIIK